MYKKFLIIISVLFCYIAILSQTTADTLSFDMEGTLDVPTKTIVIVPFSPNLYMSECDAKIGPVSKKSPSKLLNYFRNNLTLEISNVLQKNFITKPLLGSQSTIAGQASLLDKVYASISYSYDDPTIPIIEEPKKKKIIKKKTGVENGQIKAEGREIEGKYYKVNIQNKAILTELQQEFKAQLFLFISQYELKNKVSIDKNDIMSKNHSRVLRVHYTVFDATGKLLYGNFYEAELSTTVNKDIDIVKKYYPAIAESVNKNILKYK